MSGKRTMRRSIIAKIHLCKVKMLVQRIKKKLLGKNIFTSSIYVDQFLVVNRISPKTAT